MSTEVIARYPDNFRADCHEVTRQLHTGAIGLPEACQRLIALDAKYQQKLDSWTAQVNADVHRGTPAARTSGFPEAIATARAQLLRVALEVLPV